MALDNELVCNWPDEGLTGTLNIPSNGSEFVEKETYSLKITVTNTAGQTAEYEFEVTNALEHIPCLCVEGNFTGDGLGGWCYFPHSVFGTHCMNPTMRLRNITSNIDFNLVSSSGSTTVYPVIINAIGGSNQIDIDYDHSGEIDNASVAIQIEADFPLLMGTRTEYSNASVEIVRYVYDASEQGLIISEIALAGDYTNIDQAINGFEEVHTIPQNKVYFIRNILKKNGTVVDHKHYRFRVPPNGKLCLVATTHDNTGMTHNMKLKASDLGLPPTFLYMNMEASTPSWTEAHLLTPTLSDYYYGDWTDFSNGDWYKVVGTTKAGNTNIPIFANDTEAQEYFDGLRGEDTAINSGDLNAGGNISTGDDLESSDIPNPVITGSGAGCNVWLLDSGNLRSIFNDLYDDTQTTIDAIEKGVWLWGNNPIDFIIRIYYVPFDVSNFYDTITDRVWLGHYDTGRDYTKAKETKSAGQRIVLVNQTIDNVYGDFRDIDFFKYELFLPYVGFVPLDPAVYVGHTLKVEMAFNVMTHDIRYYLFVDGVLTDRVDGSVGYDIPLLGTDMVNKANNSINGIINTAKGGLETGVGIATGNIAMIGKGSLEGFDGVRSALQYPKEIIRGDISSSMNIYDINYVYLKITEKQSIYPPEITQIYNFPSYVAGPLSQLSGYCEITNIQLKSNCTESEYNEILNLLEGGVIL